MKRDRVRWLGVHLALCLGLAACALPPAGRMPVRQGSDDIATASDETDARRRARLRFELASTYYAQGQHVTALDELKQAVAADPSLPGVNELRALIYDGMGDVDRADASFRLAAQLEPANGSVLHNHAWSLCRRAQYAEADALFARAAALPQTVALPKTLLARGVCQVRAGLLAEGEKTLLRAYELDSANPATAYNLASVLLRRGDLERARFHVRRVNMVPSQVTADSLWLAIRIEHRAGNLAARDELASQLRSRFAGSREATALELERYDD